LEAERLRLRWLTTGDVDAMFSVFSDPDVMRYWSTTPMTARAAAESLLADIHDHFAKKDLFQWGIARREDDVVIGTCTLFHLSLAHRRAEIGFALGRAHWGCGLANEALQRLLEFAFEGLALHRIEADVDPRNARSIAALERLGFRREGHLRERWHVGDEICDGLFYGLLARDWRER
jgi:RimJ/RimL family protein N-acetyltransferase